MTWTTVAPEQELPLTCTRLGTCCHGKQVHVTPWEAARLAVASGLAHDAFAERHLDHGYRLRFGPRRGWRDQPTCSLYRDGSGCSAHAGRPLACRLYPLGRRSGPEGVSWIHEGNRFPCLDGCPGVRDLPRMTVAAYAADQGMQPWIAAQDACLRIVADLGDAAFAVWFDSGLAASGDTATLPRWRAVAGLSAQRRWERIPEAWRNALFLPGIVQDDGVAFADEHRELLQARAQTAFARLGDPQVLGEASALLLAMALHLAASAGGDADALARTWIARAQSLLPA